MPRNEFLDHEEDDNDFDLEVCRTDDGLPFIRKVPRNHPGKGEEEAQGQEEDTVIDGFPEVSSLAELRKGPGATTTEAHIAKLKD